MLNRLLIFVVIFIFVVGAYLAFVSVTLPNVRKALETGIEPSQTSQIFAEDKSLVMAYGKFQHKPLPINQVPEELLDALLATEDRRFYQHHGVDPIGVLRAIFQNIRSGGVHEGGSTLTQQLARNIFLSNERSIQRKIKEALLAVKLEQQLNKKQILELYLNNIYFGEGAYGVGAASSIYFGKAPEQLTLSESALLAGLPQAPSLYNPFTNPELAIKRRNEVLQNMVEVGKLKPAEATSLKEQGLHLNPLGQSLASSDAAPFFSRDVIRQVQEMFDLDEQSFWQQGFKIYTTLNANAQAAAQRQVSVYSQAYGRRGPKQQAALFSIDNTGKVIAYVGGKDFAQSQYDRVTQAKRMAGSLFKIFVYTTAIEQGLAPQTVYKDAPVTFGDWTPENYDKSHHGYMTLAQALAHSNNIIAVKLLHDLTPDAVIQTARRFGLTAAMEPNLSLALGAASVNLKEMTTAFSVFMNKGQLITPYSIDKIVDRDGRIVYQHVPESRLILQRMPRDTMVNMMRGVVRFGTARGAQLSRPVAGKTGTSDDYKDAWFIGYTPEVITGVWVGNDDNTQMPGITGGSLPARIWRGYMVKALEDYPKTEFDTSESKPIDDKDFFVYNLQNLSESESNADPDALNAGDIQAETPVNPEGTGLVDTTQPVEDESTTDPTATPQPFEPQETPWVDPAPTAPTAPVAPGKTNDDRFFDFKKPAPPAKSRVPVAAPSE